MLIHASFGIALGRRVARVKPPRPLVSVTRLKLVLFSEAALPQFSLKCADFPPKKALHRVDDIGKVAFEEREQ